MRVIENTTQKVYEVGLFEDSGLGGAMKVRLLDLPLVFGKLGPDAGFLVALAGLWRRLLLHLQLAGRAIFRCRSR